MIAQAEHIPVHLGAMPEAVAAVREREPSPGDVFVVNDPFTGGTHLPDITLVSRTDLGFAVSRAHYADVGGAEPASLPAGSTDLYQEGLVVPPVRLDGRGHHHPPRQHAQPRRAARRPARPDRRAPAGGAAAGRALRAPGPRTGRRRDGRALRVLRAAGARGDRRASRWPLRGDRRPRGAGGRACRPRGGHDRRRRVAIDFAGNRPRSTPGTSTARSPSRAPPRTSSSAASPIPTSPPREAPLRP